MSRLAQALKSRTTTGKLVLAFYDSGIGTSGWTVDTVLGGAFGLGIDAKIKDLYTYLVMNYEPGDEICLFGFSRGAYTVRSLAGMISEVGLLSREEIQNVDEAYELYRAKNTRALRVDSFKEGTLRKVNIKLLVCFDTVGALGVPDSAPFFLHLFSRRDRYTFHNTTIGPHIENAVHVCSIDEDRKGFLPTMMTPHSDRGSEQVTQKFLPGHHSGVGGGSQHERHCADIALHFVIEEVRRRGLDLDFDDSLIPDLTNAKRNASVHGYDIFSRYNFLRTIAGKKARSISEKDLLHQFVPELYKKDSTWRPVALRSFKTDLLDDKGNQK